MAAVELNQGQRTADIVSTYLCHNDIIALKSVGQNHLITKYLMVVQKSLWEVRAKWRDFK